MSIGWYLPIIITGLFDVFSERCMIRVCNIAWVCGKPDVRLAALEFGCEHGWCFPAPDPPKWSEDFKGLGLGPWELESAQDVKAFAIGWPKCCWYLLCSTAVSVLCQVHPFLTDPRSVSFLGCSGPLASPALTTWNMKLSDYLLSWSSNIRALRFQRGNLSIERIERSKAWCTWKIAELSCVHLGLWGSGKDFARA